MSSPPPQKKLKTEKEITTPLQENPMDTTFTAAAFASVESLMDYLKLNPIMAKQHIPRPRFRRFEYSLNYVAYKGGTLNQVRQVYDMYPEALVENGINLLEYACKKGVACDVLQFLAQKSPTALTKGCIMILLEHNQGMDYPLAKAVGILLDCCPGAIQTPQDRSSFNFENSLVWYALMREHSNDVLDVLVRKLVDDIITYGNQLRLGLSDAGFYRDSNLEYAYNLYNICSVSPSVARVLQPLLTTVTHVSLGINMEDIEGCISVLDSLASSMALECLHLHLDLSPSHPSAQRWCQSFQHFLSTQKTIKGLTLLFCYGGNHAGDHLVMQALTQASHSMSASWNELYIGGLKLTNSSELNKLLLEGCLPECVEFDLAQEFVLESWTQPLDLPQQSKVKSFSIQGCMSQTWIDGLCNFCATNMPCLEDLDITCHNLDFYDSYDATAPLVLLLKRGVIRRIEFDVSLDMKVICKSLETNTSLKALHFDACSSLTSADGELFANVLSGYNATLEWVSADRPGSVHPVTWAKVQYFFDLNQHGRKNVRGSDVSLCQCVNAFCEVIKARAVPITIECGPDESEKNWEERVSTGRLYGLLHESVGIWSLME